MWGRGKLRECVGSLPSARATWVGRADMGVDLAARAHAMGATIVEEGGGSDGQGPRASESGRANRRPG
jgi:hypothetical protein